MNLTFRKLAMLEKDFIAREEAAKLSGCFNNPVNKELKEKVTNLLNKVRDT